MVIENKSNNNLQEQVIISIITINYNNLYGLKKTLNSVNGQDFNKYEYIIIDGKSTDGSRELLEVIDNNNIIIIVEEDEGIYDAINKGIESASGKYLLFLNSGDIFLNKYSLKKLYRKISMLKINNIKVYYWDLLTEKGIWYFPRKKILRHFVNSFIGHSGAALFDQSIFKKIGLYDKAFKLHADRELYYKIFSTFGEESFYKLDGYFSIFELGGGKYTNKFRGIESKTEKRLIESRYKEIFHNYFENYTYILVVPYSIKIKMIIFKFIFKIIKPFNQKFKRVSV